MTGAKIAIGSAMFGLLWTGSSATMAVLPPVEPAAILDTADRFSRLTPLAMMWVVALGLVWALCYVFKLLQKRQEEDRKEQREQIAKITSAMIITSSTGERMASAVESQNEQAKELLAAVAYCRENNRK